MKKLINHVDTSSRVADGFALAHSDIVPGADRQFVRPAHAQPGKWR